MAESLRGKVLSYELFPLSFKGFFKYLEESLFLITISNRANLSAARKIYLMDNGLYQTLRNKPDRGQL